MVRTGYAHLTFLTDYGLDDAFVGVCKGVIAGIAPQVSVIDICHQIAPQDVRHAATTLAASAPYFPAAVHLAIVDPLRDEPARPVAVRTKSGSLLVGPDNGILSLAWVTLDGVEAAYAVDTARAWMPGTSSTFRGRDLFSPVAAHLAAGMSLGDAGREIEPQSLTALTERTAVVEDDHVHGEVRSVDHFGNLSLNVARADLEVAGMHIGDDVEVRCPGRTLRVPFRLRYGEVAPGRVVVCEDVFRAVMIAQNQGSAAEFLRLRRGDPVVVSRARGALR